jgi:hypothetical protein
MLGRGDAVFTVQSSAYKDEEYAGFPFLDIERKRWI